MDAFDARLLALVQRDARRTAEDLGRAIGLSASAVQKRLRRLRRDGYILREIALLSPKAAPEAMLFSVRVTLTPGRVDAILAFLSQMEAAEEVLQCFHVTGDADFVLLVAARGMPAYEAFAKRCFSDAGLVARYETSVVMRVAKLGFELPVSA